MILAGRILGTLAGVLLWAVTVAWASWLVMIVVGAMAGLDVVGMSMGFVDALPYGAILAFFGPFTALLLVARTRKDPAHP